MAVVQRSDPRNIHSEVEAMATYYVDSNATGLNSGTSWTDAWTSIQSSDGSATTGGDVVLVASDHDEQVTGNIYAQYSGGVANNPVQVISTNKSTGAYEKGASLRAINGNYDIFLDGNVRVQGLICSPTRYNYLANNITYAVNEYEDCDFQIDSTSGAGNRRMYIGSNNSYNSVKFRNCKFDFTYASSSSQFALHMHRDVSPVRFESCEFVGHSTMTSIFNTAGGNGHHSLLKFSGCKFTTTNSSTKLASISAEYRGEYILDGCEIPSQWATSCLNTTAKRSEFNVEIYNSFYGTLTNPAVPVFLKESHYGKVMGNTSVYRSSGASDGTTNYSLELATNSDAQEINNPVCTNQISKYVEAGSQTITLYLASSASLSNDDFWVEVYSPSEESSATARSKYRSTCCQRLATPAALTSDTSSWTGSGVGTVQKVEVAIAPTVAGTVTVSAFLAKPSTTVYVDPKISTDGSQKGFNGVIVDGEKTQTTAPAFHPLG